MARPTLMRHRKFLRLVAALGSQPMARGVLELMWDSAYESGDERIGSADDLELVAGWIGERGVLAQALVSCGFVDRITDSDLRVHDLWHHAPDYVQKRRKRELARQERLAPSAKKRRPANNGAVRRTVVAISGQPARDDRTPSPSPSPALIEDPPRVTPAKPHPIRDLIGHYQQLFEQRYGQKPVISGDKEAGIFKNLLKHHPADVIQRALSAYFTDEWASENTGHALELFVSQINKWLAKSARTAQPSANHPVRDYSHHTWSFGK